LQLVILAGGMGTRLRPITDKLPKSMVEVVGKPFLQYQLQLSKRNHIQNIVLCVGYRSDLIRDFFGDGGRFGVNISYSEDGDKLLGPSGALKKASNLLDDEFLLLNGDSYLPIDFSEPITHFKVNHKKALMVAYKNTDLYGLSNIVVEGGLVKNYDRNRKLKDMVYIDYGLTILRKEVLGSIYPNDRQLDNLYQDLCKSQELLAFITKVRFYEIGSFKGLYDFEKYVRVNMTRNMER